MTAPVDPDRFLGRLAPHPESTHPRLKFGDFLAPGYAATVPPSVDFLSLVGGTWPMFANNRLSNCTCAAAGHTEEVWSKYGTSNLVIVTDADVIRLYEQASGYNPADPSTDKGAVMQDVFEVWRRVGLGSHRLAAFVQIDPHDQVLCKTALYYFGALNVGANLPRAAIQQTNAGQLWDVVPGMNTTDVGGHAFHVGAVTDTGIWEGTTWGRLQGITPKWWDTYVEEVWAPISLEWTQQGTAPNHLLTVDMNAEFTNLTHGQPGPFPVPVAPPPPPVPPAPASNPDGALVAAAWPWSTQWHIPGTDSAKVAAALVAWRKAKGD